MPQQGQDGTRVWSVGPGTDCPSSGPSPAPFLPVCPWAGDSPFLCNFRMNEMKKMLLRATIYGHDGGGTHHSHWPPTTCAPEMGQCHRAPPRSSHGTWALSPLTWLRPSAFHPVLSLSLSSCLYTQVTSDFTDTSTQDPPPPLPQQSASPPLLEGIKMIFQDPRFLAFVWVGGVQITPPIPTPASRPLEVR